MYLILVILAIQEGMILTQVVIYATCTLNCIVPTKPSYL